MKQGPLKERYALIRAYVIDMLWLSEAFWGKGMDGLQINQTFQLERGQRRKSQSSTRELNPILPIGK